MVGFEQLLSFVYEAQGYLAEQSDDRAEMLYSEATYLLQESGYAAFLAREDY